MLDISALPSYALAAIAAGLLRNIAGWLENALRDGKIEPYEWKQLAGTIIGYFAAVTLFAQGMDVGEAVAATYGLDALRGALKR